MTIINLPRTDPEIDSPSYRADATTASTDSRELANQNFHRFLSRRQERAINDDGADWEPRQYWQVFSSKLTRSLIQGREQRTKIIGSVVTCATNEKAGGAIDATSNSTAEVFPYPRCMHVLIYIAVESR